MLELAIALAVLVALLLAGREVRNRRRIKRAAARLLELAAMPAPDEIPRAPDPPRSIRRGHRRRGAARKTRRGRWDRWA